jgi:hypothetical protein
METICNSIYAINNKHTKKVKFTLVKVSELTQKNKVDSLECGICYKHISNKMFICSEPCNKVFHLECLDKMIDRIEDIVDDVSKKPDYRCCYCRRSFDINNYDLTLFTQELLYLKNIGYKINDVLIQASFNSVIHGDETNYTEYEYELFTPINISHIKSPKKSKRSEFKREKKSFKKKILIYKGRC